jgi:hypothetical protein
MTVAFGLEIDELDRDDTGATTRARCSSATHLRYRVLTAEGTG